MQPQSEPAKSISAPPAAAPPAPPAPAAISGMTLRNIVRQKQQDAAQQRTTYSLLPSTKNAVSKIEGFEEDDDGMPGALDLEPSAFLKGVLSVIEDQEEQWPWLFDSDADGGSSSEEDDGAAEASNEAIGSAAADAANEASAAAASAASAAAAAALAKREHAESMRLFDAHQARKKKKAYKKMMGQRHRLPAYQMRQDIVRQISAAQVVVVSG